MVATMKAASIGASTAAAASTTAASTAAAGEGASVATAAAAAAAGAILTPREQRCETCLTADRRRSCCSSSAWSGRCSCRMNSRTGLRSLQLHRQSVAGGVRARVAVRRSTRVRATAASHVATLRSCCSDGTGECLNRRRDTARCIVRLHDRCGGRAIDRPTRGPPDWLAACSPRSATAIHSGLTCLRGQARTLCVDPPVTMESIGWPCNRTTRGHCSSRALLFAAVIFVCSVSPRPVRNQRAAGLVSSSLLGLAHSLVDIASRRVQCILCLCVQGMVGN